MNCGPQGDHDTNFFDKNLRTAPPPTPMYFLFPCFKFFLSYILTAFFMIYPEEEEDALFSIYIRILVNDGIKHR